MRPRVRRAGRRRAGSARPPRGRAARRARRSPSPRPPGLPPSSVARAANGRTYAGAGTAVPGPAGARTRSQAPPVARSPEAPARVRRRRGSRTPTGRRPRGRPPLARRLAHRRCCSRWVRVRAGAVVLRRAARPGRHRRRVRVVVRGAVRDRSAWGPPAAALGVVPVLLLPVVAARPCCTAPARGCCSRRAGCRSPTVDALDLLTGRFGDLGAPWWLGVVARRAGGARPGARASTRIPVLVCWIVAAGRGGDRRRGRRLHARPAADHHPAGLGFLLVVLQGALRRRRLARRAGLASAPRPGAGAGVAALAAVLVAVAAAVPLGGLGWFVRRRPRPARRDRGRPASRRTWCRAR